jgi:hypothetical protein
MTQTDSRQADYLVALAALRDAERTRDALVPVEDVASDRARVANMDVAERYAWFWALRDVATAQSRLVKAEAGLALSRSYPSP